MKRILSLFKLLRKLLLIVLMFTISYVAFKIFLPVEKDMNYLNKMLLRAIDESAWPGGVLIAGDNKNILIKKSSGYHTYQQESKTRLDDIFDLASLTKVIATTTMAMKLYEDEKLDIETPVYKIFPEFSKNKDINQEIWKKRVKIKHLLNHTSGMRDARLYSLNMSTESKIKIIIRRNLTYAPGSKVVYSDFNFILLGKILEKISDTSMDKYLKENIYSPLKMNDTLFTPPENLYHRIVPTEFSREDQDFIHGRVHDGNSHTLGGIVGHAGLFSTAEDLSKLCRLLLNHGREKNLSLFSQKTIDTFTTPISGFKEKSRCLGWDRPSGFAAGGVYQSDKTFGHNGYTGTSLWIDVENNLYVILLTNGVHPHYSFKKPNYFDWRQKIHTTVYEIMGYNKRNTRLKIKKRWDSLINRLSEKLFN